MEDSRSLLANLNSDSKRIFDIIINKGPITKRELLEITNMKLTTLNRFMDPLEKFEFIEEYGIAESSGGRKPVLYDVKQDCYYIVGVDISRTYTQIIVVNMKMDILFRELYNMDEKSSPINTVNTASNIIVNALEKLNISLNKILGIGIGAVGPIDRKRGIINNPVNFPSGDWGNVPIKAMFQEKFNLPVFIDNGANTAALAEYIFGVGKGLKNIAYFNCGIGIRTGAITLGIVTRSVNDREDAFGHMVIDVDGELCSCGNYGCIESYSSIKAITKKFISEIKKGRDTNINKPLDKIDYKDIMKASENNDKLSSEVIINAAAVLGAGLANYINLINPYMVILSGPLIKSSDLFYEICTKVAMKKNLLFGSRKVLFNKGGKFAENAISVGAAVLVIENMLNWR